MNYMIGADPAEVVDGTAYRRYRKYLEDIRGQIPQLVYEQAMETWRYDFRDPRCPHDSWLQQLIIQESGKGDRLQYRSTDIEIELLGAFHDRILKIEYRNVLRYSLDSMTEGTGHESWEIDEVGLSDRFVVCHKIKFSSGAFWYIECERFSFSEERLRRQP